MPLESASTLVVHAIFDSPLNKALQNLVSLVGVERTISAIEDIYKKQFLVKAPDAVFIRRLIARELDCTDAEILEGNSRNQTRYISIGFCCYYLYVVLKYPIEDVVYMMNKNMSVCYKTIKIIKELNPRHRADQAYVKIKERLDKAVTEYKLTKK